MEVDAKVLNGLGAKLDALELTAEESATLDTILRRAEQCEDAEVEGHGLLTDDGTLVLFKGSDEELQATRLGSQLGRSLGFNIGMPPSRFNIGMPPS